MMLVLVIIFLVNAVKADLLGKDAWTYAQPQINLILARDLRGGIEPVDILNETFKHSSWDGEPRTKRYITQQLSKRERKIDNLLKQTSNILQKVEEHSGCPSDINTKTHCKLHWLPKRILHLTSKLEIIDMVGGIPMTEREKKIQLQLVMISKLIENMIDITECGKPEEKEQQKEKSSKSPIKKVQKKGKQQIGKTAAKKNDKGKNESEEDMDQDKIDQEKEKEKDLIEDGGGAKEVDTEDEEENKDEDNGESDETNSTNEPKSDCQYSVFEESHSMLLPPSDCKILRTGVSETDKEDILKYHNEFRSTIAAGNESRGEDGPQPPASNMREMVWNEQLAEVAEAWAKQCYQGHDLHGARKICNRDYYVNQNLHFYYGPSPEIVWEDAVKTWYNEVADMQSDIPSSFRKRTDKKIGHYTQVVWADTNEVGCGLVEYEKEINGAMYPKSKIYACNYGPAGNIVSLPMYKQGQGASDCENGVSENYPSLCT